MINLPEYSYFIFGITGSNTIKQGTCFFIRKNSKTYMVTAAHNLNGWSPFKQAYDPNVPSTLYLRVYRKSDGDVEFLPIDLTQLKASMPKFNGYETPDIYIHELNIDDKFQLNSLESLLNDFMVPVTNPAKIITHGYPVNDEVDDQDQYIRLPPSSTDLFLKQDYKLPLTWLQINKQDYINYQVTFSGSNLRHGYSGSPAYFIADRGQSNKVTFGGMLVSADPERHTAEIIRPEYIKRLIEDL